MPLNPYLHLVIYFYFRTNAASAGAAEARLRQGQVTMIREMTDEEDPAAPKRLAPTRPAIAEYATRQVSNGGFAK
jgi:hypothetical protein